jgi:hypothetical protein
VAAVRVLRLRRNAGGLERGGIGEAGVAIDAR